MMQHLLTGVQASSSKTGVGFVQCGAMNSDMRGATSSCAVRNWSKVIYYLPTHLVCAHQSLIRQAQKLLDLQICNFLLEGSNAELF
jgi:hypothetical protein